MYTISDSAAPLVFLPGLICDRRMFTAQLATFDGATVIEGYYGGARTLADMAAYALERMPERFSLLGHSMGARVALEVMRAAPDRIERLALADTGIHLPRPGEQESRFAFRDLGRREGAAALVDAWLPGMMSKRALADATLMQRLRAMAISAGVEVYEAQIEALLARRSVEAVLPGITYPTLVIVGEEDRWSPVAQHEEIAALIPGARLRIIAEAGHMAPAEQPEAFNAALAEWLSWPAPRPTSRTSNEKA